MKPPCPMGVPKLNEDGEVVVAVTFPTEYGECTQRRLVPGDVLDAVLNQLDEEGTSA